MALRLTLPLVPVIVNVNVPVDARLLGVTVSIDAPEPMSADGLKLAVVRLGSPLTLSVTASAKPPIGVTVTM